MKAKNPKAETTAKAANDLLRAGVLAIIENSGLDAVDFEAIRSATPAAKRAEIPDGVIHQICLDAGLTVQR